MWPLKRSLHLVVCHPFLLIALLSLRCRDISRILQPGEPFYVDVVFERVVRWYAGYIVISFLAFKAVIHNELSLLIALAALWFNKKWNLLISSKRTLEAWSLLVTMSTKSITIFYLWAGSRGARCLRSLTGRLEIPIDCCPVSELAAAVWTLCWVMRSVTFDRFINQ